MACAGAKDIRKEEDTVAAVAASRLAAYTAVVETLKGQFGARPGDVPSAFRSLTLVPSSDSLFPDDDQIKAHVGGNDALRRFAERLPGSRANPYYLFDPTGNVYWPSEYMYEVKPADFRCSFILHLERLEQGRTRVEVIEYLPRSAWGESSYSDATALASTQTFAK